MFEQVQLPVLLDLAVCSLFRLQDSVMDQLPVLSHLHRHNHLTLLYSFHVSLAIELFLVSVIESNSYLNQSYFISLYVFFSRRCAPPPAFNDTYLSKARLAV
jgi:hypothetical protein